MSYKAVSTVFSEVFIFEPVEQQGENGVVNFQMQIQVVLLELI
jgi:hypothetical protein